MAEGFIYFIRPSHYAGGVKIGFTIDPEARIKALTHEIGIPLTLVGLVNGTREHEKAIHAYLSHKRLFGEWFKSGITVTNLINPIIGKGFPDDFLTAKSKYFAQARNSRHICQCGGKVPLSTHIKRARLEAK